MRSQAFFLSIAFLVAVAGPVQAQVNEDHPAIIYFPNGGVAILASQDAADAYGREYGVKIEPGRYVYTKGGQVRPAISGGLVLIGQGVTRADFMAFRVGFQALFAGLVHDPIGILFLVVLVAAVVTPVVLRVRKRRRAA